MSDVLDDYRCTCGKLLFRGLILSGSIETKCRFCKKLQTIGQTTSSSNGKDYLLITNERGTVVRASESAAQLLGHTTGTLSGMHIHDLLVLLAPNFYTELWDALYRDNRTAVTFRSLHKHKDCSLSPVAIQARQLRNESGEYVALSIEKARSNRVHFSTGGTLQATN